MDTAVIIVGAGAAGLAAAFELGNVGTVHGAIATGKRAAQQIIASVGQAH
jgi:monoamine oxidase